MTYQWWRFIHFIGIAGFLVSHGASVGMAMRIRRERDRGRIQAMLQLSTSTMSTFYASTAVLLAGGIGAGFVGQWWGRGWIWASVGLLAGITLAMFALARPYYRKLGRAVQMRPSGNPVVSDAELDALLRSPQAVVVAVIGFGGLAGIIYLMVFKPF